MPKELAPIVLEQDAWYEVSTTGSFYYIYLHPYSPIVALCIIYSSWQLCNKYFSPLINSVNDLSQYIKKNDDNSIKKIYVKGGYTNASQPIILPITSNPITVKITSDIV